MTHSVQVFSTQGFPIPRKAEMWNMMLEELTEAAQVQPRDPMHFDGTLVRQRMGSITLFEIRCAGVRLRHRRSQRRGGRPTFQVLMPVQSEFTLAHGQQPSAVVGAGACCLLDQTEPYELMHGDGLCAIGIELPHSLLESCLPHSARHAGGVVRPDTAAGRVLSGMMQTLGLELQKPQDPGAWPTLIGRSIAGFVAAAFADRERPVLQRGSRARLAAYREYVESRISDGDFRSLDVARHFKVSERYVRMIFQSSGESLSTFLLRTRLERAAALLGSAHGGGVSITDVALECGFNNASHFGQSFRRRFGVTPREYRTRSRT